MSHVSAVDSARTLVPRWSKVADACVIPVTILVEKLIQGTRLDKAGKHTENFQSTELIGQLFCRLPCNSPDEQPSERIVQIVFQKSGARCFIRNRHGI